MVHTREIRLKLRDREGQDVEMGEEHHGKSSNRAEVDVSMAQGPVFIHPPVLVVFGIVGQDGEDLK